MTVPELPLELRERVMADWFDALWLRMHKRYPTGLLRGVCNYMFATTREGGWMDARDELIG